MLAGAYLTYSELFDQRPSQEDVIDLLRGISTKHAVSVISFMNLSLRFVMQEPDRPAFGPIQQRLIAGHLDQETLSRLEQRFPFVKCDERPIFFPQNLLSVLSLVLTNSNNDTDISSDNDERVRLSIGRACLMMNNLLLSETEEENLLRGSEEERRIELMVQSLGPFEIANSQKAHHVLPRMRVMYTTLLKDERVKARIFKICEGFELDNSFATQIGISLDRWLFIIVAIYSYYLHGGDPALSRPEFMQIDPDAFVGSSGVSEAELKIVLKTIAALVPEFKTTLQMEGLSDPRHNFVPFRSRPLIVVERNKVLPADIAFILDKLHNGVHWTLHDALPRDRRKILFRAWGILFEEYVHWLLGGMKTGLQITYFRSPAWSMGGESFDGVLVQGGVLGVAEYKGGFLSAAARYSGQKEIFLQELNDQKFTRGCEQLAAKIATVFAADEVDRRTIEDVPVQQVRSVLPLLVLQDHISRVPFLNWYLNKKFQEKLDLSRLRTGVLVRPLTVINIQELESMVYSAEAENFDFMHAMHHRTVRDTEVLSGVLEALVPLEGFGKRQSERQKMVLQELGGPMFDYLFPGKTHVE